MIFPTQNIHMWFVGEENDFSSEGFRLSNAIFYRRISSLTICMFTSQKLGDKASTSFASPSHASVRNLKCSMRKTLA
jgi:hypothetical protein